MCISVFVWLFTQIAWLLDVYVVWDMCCICVNKMCPCALPTPAPPPPPPRLTVLPRLIHTKKFKEQIKTLAKPWPSELWPAGRGTGVGQRDIEKKSCISYHGILLWLQLDKLLLTLHSMIITPP